MSTTKKPVARKTAAPAKKAAVKAPAAKKPVRKPAAKKPIAKRASPFNVDWVPDKETKKPAVKKPVAMTKGTAQRAARPKLEKEVRDEADAWAELRGWLVQKLVSLTAGGFPDCFYARHGRIVLGEWKKPGTGVLSPLQVQRHKQLREHGVEVHVFDDLEGFQELMK